VPGLQRAGMAWQYNDDLGM